MTEALGYLYYIYDKFIDLVFNRLEIVANVSIGWVIISVMLFSMLIRSILNLPRGVHFDKAPNIKQKGSVKHE